MECFVSLRALVAGQRRRTETLPQVPIAIWPTPDRTTLRNFAHRMGAIP
jgi:hypothetical protein